MVLRPLTLIGIIISIVTGTSLGVVLHIYYKKDPAPPAETLSEALRHVQENYVETISEEKLLKLAIDGMMDGLDDHSDYLDPSAFNDLEANATGKFGGIGIELGLVDGYFTVIAPMDDTPAQDAGLKPGDRITGVDGTPVRGKKLPDLVNSLRGVPGSTVELAVYRKDADRSMDLTIERAVIRVASVRSRLLEPDIAYVRISQFQTQTGEDLGDELAELEEENGAPLGGLVLDLRNNPGGTLLSSVEVADQFLDEGLIVYTQGRLKSSFARYRATRGDDLDGSPIVVLINGGSASASEIVAGALQDHGRARVGGSRSFGKGSVQSVVPLDEKQALKITTAYYYTPNGRSIHKKGIEPDIEFKGETHEELLAEAVDLLKQMQPDTRHARLDEAPVRDI